VTDSFGAAAVVDHARVDVADLARYDGRDVARQDGDHGGKGEPADDAYRSRNPTGKYPCLETEDGSLLGESKVILNYLEEAYPAVPLLPANPLSRARVRELMEIIDLYLELPARRLYPQALFDGKVSAETPFQQ
jgi:glutathione S-transferase